MLLSRGYTIGDPSILIICYYCKPPPLASTICEPRETKIPYSRHGHHTRPSTIYVLNLICSVLVTPKFLYRSLILDFCARSQLDLGYDLGLTKSEQAWVNLIDKFNSVSKKLLSFKSHNPITLN